MISIVQNIVTSIKENGVFQGTIDAYLQKNMTPAGASIHCVAIVGSSFTGNRNLSYPKVSLGAVDLASTIMSVTSQVSTQVNGLQELYEATKDPNIEGIPIISPSIQVSREVTVSDYGVIMDSGYMKKNVVDNAVPRPRTWEINGYLTSKWGIDIGFTMKPSLVMQAKTLDAFAQSRKPLWFKTDEFEFVRTQITNLTINRKAEVMNAYEVSITLKEFVPLEIFTKASKLSKALFILTH